MNHNPRIIAPVLAPDTVGVLGSGAEANAELAEPLGELLAVLGVNLLTGGGAGTMESVARAFVGAQPRRGISIGVLPCLPDDPAASPPGYPNPFVQLAVRTHLPGRGRQGDLSTSRNHVNVLTADVLIALPGGHGTASEVRLALAYRKPIAAYSLDEDAVASFPRSVARLQGIEAVEAFIRGELGRRRAPGCRS